MIDFLTNKILRGSDVELDADTELLSSRVGKPVL